MGTKLYVGNLDYQTTSDDLAELFAGAGQVRSARVITDRDTQRSKGFAFVEMSTDEEATKAISLYNGQVLHDRTLIVNEARPQESQYGRPGGNARPGGSARPGGPRFREVKHKARGGRKARLY